MHWNVYYVKFGNKKPTTTQSLVKIILTKLSIHYQNTGLGRSPKYKSWTQLHSVGLVLFLRRTLQQVTNHSDLFCFVDFVFAPAFSKKNIKSYCFILKKNFAAQYVTRMGFHHNSFILIAFVKTVNTSHCRLPNWRSPLSNFM